MPSTAFISANRLLFSHHPPRNPSIAGNPGKQIGCKDGIHGSFPSSIYSTLPQVAKCRNSTPDAPHRPPLQRHQLAHRRLPPQVS